MNDWEYDFDQPIKDLVKDVRNKLLSDIEKEIEALGTDIADFDKAYVDQFKLLSIIKKMREAT